jgi:cellulose synthase/poly-beta-1,6-N-acetylglucosamine synthase-like glycosyltransferase
MGQIYTCGARSGTSLAAFQRPAGALSFSAPMFQGRTVSLVIPAYNEEETIGAVVEEFRQSPFLDEILVVDNNCKDRTAEIAARAGARVVLETRPGYGSALLAGMSAAKGDILALVEADGTFRARTSRSCWPTSTTPASSWARGRRVRWSSREPTCVST